MGLSQNSSVVSDALTRSLIESSCSFTSTMTSTSVPSCNSIGGSSTVPFSVIVVLNFKTLITLPVHNVITNYTSRANNATSHAFRFNANSTSIISDNGNLQNPSQYVSNSAGAIIRPEARIIIRYVVRTQFSLRGIDDE